MSNIAETRNDETIEAMVARYKELDVEIAALDKRSMALRTELWEIRTKLYMAERHDLLDMLDAEKAV